MNAAPLIIPAAIVAALVGLIAAAIFARGVLARPEGPERVQFIGRLIRQGAMAFLRREYTMLAAFAAVVAVVIAVLIDFNVLGNARIAELNAVAGELRGVGPWTALAYVAGAIGSAIAGFAGMGIAIRANTRTAAAAMDGVNAALRVAFGSGSVM
ncbi:MAG TPA: sodium/proton-translocating pyrophosphatase, partial [Vitreimonas sp.]|nr:sodium/proton-translocating pyrophosphatase [Vitreimonas sp.]